MQINTKGIHHITAMSGHPQRNVDFYSGLLGLRLVKVTVNYDDPDTYHLYYGDGAGSPGSILTFFPWPSTHKGFVGSGQVGVTAFSVPKESLGFWKSRLEAAGYHPMIEERFGEKHIALADPDGMLIEIVGTDSDPRAPWDRGTVPVEHAIRGFHRADLFVKQADPTISVLREVLGYEVVGEEEQRTRLAVFEGAPNQIIEIVAQAERPFGQTGGGAVHHVAFRAESDEHHLQIRQRALAAKRMVTDVIDRTYFNAIYFREPGGVLFEVATDAPGFATDEPMEALGEKLVLPAWLESRRPYLEETLLTFRLPNGIEFPKAKALA